MMHVPIYIRSSWTLRLLKKANHFYQKQEKNEYSITLTSYRIEQNPQICFKVTRTAYTSKLSLSRGHPIVFKYNIKMK